MLITFAELFQGREEWKLCAKWCDRAIPFVEGLMTSPVPDAGQQNSAMAEPSMLAGLLTLRGVSVSSRQASHDSQRILWRGGLHLA